MRRMTVYISGPISNGGRASPEERLENVRKAIGIFIELVNAGFAPLCPQLTEFVEIESGAQLPHKVWMEVDLPWVQSAETILRLPGDSTGSDIEVREAKAVGIPVFYTVADLIAFARDEGSLSAIESPEELAGK